MNLMAVAGVLAALLVLLLRVDRPVVTPAAAAEVVAAGVTIPVTLLLRAVHAPAELSLTIAGKPVVLRGTGLQRQGETLLELKERSLELALKAAWPPGTPPSMVEVRAAPDGMEEQVFNVWAESGAADEIVRFTWRVPP